MHSIFFLDRARTAPRIVRRRPQFDLELIEHERTDRDDVAARLTGASIAIANKVSLTGSMLEQCPRCA